MKALVTGSTGFSGRAVVSLLESRGAIVHRVSHRSEQHGVTRMDLTDADAWGRELERTRPDAVVHLAGVAETPAVATMVKLNVLAAAALMDAVGRSLPSATVLVVGSAAEYGELSEQSLPVREDAPTHPVTLYGATKWLQTRVALEAARRGLQVIIARPSNIVGPTMPEHLALGSFARQLREVELGKRPAVLRTGDLSSVRDFIDVRDAARAYVELLSIPAAVGEVVHVSSGVGIPMRDALNRLVQAFGVKVDMVEEPGLVGGRRPTGVRTGGSTKSGASVFCASREKFERLVGVRPLIVLEQTLDDIVRYERARQTA